MNELNTLKTEIRELHSKLNSEDRKKEDLFREKKRIGSEIHSKIRNASEYKEKRNSLTSIVKNTKLSKEELEKKLTDLESEIAKLKEDRKKVLEKSGVDDPVMLKRTIKKLEYRIETEAISFEKEKEIMKSLSKMRKQLEKASESHAIERQLDHKFRDLRDVKEQLEMHKKIVQHSAKESQKHHVELIESSKEIDDLRSKEEQFEENIQKIKSDINALGTELDAKLAQMDVVRKKLQDNNVQLKEDIEKSKQEILKQKDTAVQEKIKSGKKLTTEDLLILQRTMK